MVPARRSSRTGARARSRLEPTRRHPPAPHRAQQGHRQQPAPQVPVRRALPRSPWEHTRGSRRRKAEGARARSRRIAQSSANTHKCGSLTVIIHAQPRPPRSHRPGTSALWRPRARLRPVRRTSRELQLEPRSAARTAIGSSQRHRQLAAASAAWTGMRRANEHRPNARRAVWERDAAVRQTLRGPPEVPPIPRCALRGPPRAAALGSPPRRTRVPEVFERAEGSSLAPPGLRDGQHRRVADTLMLRTGSEHEGRDGN